MPKTGGRKKGTPNVITTLSRQTFNDFVMNYMQSKQFTEDWAALTPKERVQTIVSMSGFVVPTPKSIDVNLSVQGNKALESSFAELAAEDDQ